MSGPASYVRRRGCRAGRTAKRKQTLSADRTCPQPSSPAPSDRVSSSAVLGCLNVRSLQRKYDDVIELCRERRIDLLCLTETWHDADSARRPRSSAATASSTDRVHAPLTTTCPSTMPASSSCQPPTSVCRWLPSLNDVFWLFLVIGLH